MIIGPKYKIAKRLGAAIFEKTQTQKFALSEARSAQNKKGKGRPGGMSDYNKQLIEKQKMRFSYGISERQLSRYAEEAVTEKGEPTTLLLKKLESRLDNVVYRMNIAKTRRLARQMVSHGHILVNGKRVTIPSYQVKVKDMISVREGSRVKPLFTSLAENYEGANLPSWVRFDIKKFSGETTADPVHEAAMLFDPALVLEFYSR